ncbi:MAG: sugar ABC transporter permease [Spirochaetaceae bacterium]|nr:sugar ABC transporter permease [Spirochaetaceae bacterium]
MKKTVNMNPFVHGKNLGWVGPYLILAPALLLFTIFHLLPSLATIGFSFTDITRTGYKPTSFVGLDNYFEFFKPGQFHEKQVAIKNSLVFAFFVVILQNAFALIFAVLLDKAWKGRAFYRGVLFLPVILGITVNALLWRLMFNPFGGPVNTLLKAITGENALFFADPKMAFPLIIFIQIWSNIGYSTVIFLSGLQAIPKELYESAKVDGAAGIKSFWMITIPLIAQATTVNILLSIIGALRTFDTIMVTTGGQYDTYTMAYYMYRLAFQSTGGSGIGGGRLGFASAVGTLLFLMILVIALIAQYFLRKKEVDL